MSWPRNEFAATPARGRETVNARTLAALARLTSKLQDRRASLKALGTAALAATIVPPLAAEAGKAGKKAKKKCKKQVGKCKSAVEERCEGNEKCLFVLLPCCDPYKTCNAGDGTECWLDFILSDAMAAEVRPR
jgi:hypothetical protein